MAFRILGAIIIILLLTINYNNADWSGHVCTRIGVRTMRQKICLERGYYGYCRRSVYITRPTRYIQKYCCYGWTHRGRKDCSIPMCYPRCQNGGRCIRPNTCKCKPGYNGAICNRVVQ